MDNIEDLLDTPRSERVESLPDIPGEKIDQIPKEDRLAPKVSLNHDIDHYEKLAQENETHVFDEVGGEIRERGLTRSERVQILFGWRPTDYQALVLDYPERVDRAQVAPQKGRQTGATTIAGYIGADHALFNRGIDVLYTAPGQDTADEMFNEFKDAFKDGPFTLKQYGVAPNEDNKQTWEFVHGVRALSRTLGNVNQDNNSGNRGFSPTCVIVDEAAYSYSEVFEEELEPFFITHPKYEYYLFSTPAGKTGYYYDSVEHEGYRDIDKAAENEFSWYAPYWPTKISPFAQQDYIERQREKKDSQTFEEEYLGKFADAEDSYLPHEIVKPCVDPDVTREPSPRWLGVDPAEKGDDELVIYDIDANGDWHNIWSKETVTGTDFVGLLTDLQTAQAVPEPKVGTGDTPADGYENIVVESNMAGLATDIAQAGLGDVIMPVKSTKKSKGPMYKRLKRDLEAQEISLPNYRKLISQTTALQYSYTANNHLKLEHPPNGHDDHPDAMMLANAGRTGLAREYQTGIEGKQPTITRTSGNRPRSGSTIQ